MSYKLLEMRRIFNKKIFLYFPVVICFCCCEEYYTGLSQNSLWMSHLVRIWWPKEQNILSALSSCFRAPSIRSVHWPYNDKAICPVDSGEISEWVEILICNIYFLKSHFWHVGVIFAVSSKSLTDIRGRFQLFLNAPPDPTFNGKSNRSYDLPRKLKIYQG